MVSVDVKHHVYFYFDTPTDPPAGGEKPVIKETTSSLTVRQSETVELPCVSSQAYPVPNYTWIKDGKAVNIDNYHYRQLGGNLVIVNSTVRDTGSYVCTASNAHGTDRATSVLTVYCEYAIVLWKLIVCLYPLSFFRFMQLIIHKYY